jgi:GH15 family glucan-1,4-alpha-glucosidase
MRDDDRWRAWGQGLSDTGPYGNAVLRSLTTLRLLTYSPSGAPVAAATTSLPEVTGGSRNWDYRFAWPRDAAFGIGAFVGVGEVGEARAFLFWLLHASRLDRPRLRPVLTLDGKPVPPEVELEDWPGYRGSRPVRLGNDAGRQHQLDTYGWVVDAAYLLVQAGQPLNRETWRVIAGFADYICGHWSEPDAGIWEVRTPAQFVHSKMLGWLALDRAARLAGTGYRVSRRRLERWRQQQDTIAATVLDHGFARDRNTYVRSYGSNELDAALLVLPLLGIDQRTPQRVLGTIGAIRRALDAGNGLIYRYPRGRDGLEGDEGAFLPCSFWLVQALAKTGQVDEAARLFEKLLSHGNELGLFGEEVDADTGETIGNYPQALTHATVVQAALALRDAMKPGEAIRARSRKRDGRQA